MTQPPEEIRLIDYTWSCSHCGKKITQRVDSVGVEFLKETKSGLMNVLACDACSRKLAPSVTEYFRSKREPSAPQGDSVLKALITRWIPLIYQESNVERFPQQIWQTHKHWVPGPKGLMFYGPSRLCKSRVAYAIAMHHLGLKKTVECYDPRSFRAMIERRINDKTLWTWYENGALAPVFLLDDLGKFKGEGRRIEEEVFNLIKLRHEAKLGMLVTTNHGIRELAATFTPSIGIPIVERLRELCTPVEFVSLTPETKVSHRGPHNADL